MRHIFCHLWHCALVSSVLRNLTRKIHFLGTCKCPIFCVPKEGHEASLRSVSSLSIMWLEMHLAFAVQNQAESCHTSRLFLFSDLASGVLMRVSDTQELFFCLGPNTKHVDEVEGPSTSALMHFFGWFIPLSRGGVWLWKPRVAVSPFDNVR